MTVLTVNITEDYSGYPIRFRHLVMQNLGDGTVIVDGAIQLPPPDGDGHPYTLPIIGAGAELVTWTPKIVFSRPATVTSLVLIITT